VLLDIVRIAAPLIVAYLVGAIPWSLIVGKRFYGIDLREHGSGNLGATNVFRTLGARAGAVVFALDVAKGAAAVALAMLLCPFPSGDARDWVLVGTALAAVLGHSFSPYIRFRGGKGVATAAGAVAVMTPLIWPVLFLTFVLTVALSRMVSLGSIVIALEFPVLVWFVYSDRRVLFIFALVASTLVIGRHWANIKRIARGEESRISLSGRGAALTHDDSED
jgi:glycerol-3-phosphate acyltransferase PlsY